MKHNIVMTCEAKTPDALLLKRQIRKCILAALDEEGVDVPCEINVLLTDDASIRAINKAYRNIDKATDVLAEFRSAIWQSLSSGQSSRRRSSGTRPGARPAISQFTRFCTCWAMTTSTRVP